MPASSPAPRPWMSEYHDIIQYIYIYIYYNIYNIYIYNYIYIILILSFHLHQPFSEHFRTLGLAGTFLTVWLLRCAWLVWNRAWAPSPKCPPNKRIQNENNWIERRGHLCPQWHPSPFKSQEASWRCQLKLKFLNTLVCYGTSDERWRATVV